MSSVLGVSAGAGAVRIAHPTGTDATGRFSPDLFEIQTVFTTYQQLEELVADSIGVLVDSLPPGAITVVAYRTEQDAETLRTAMERRQLPNCKLVPETAAAVEFLTATGDVKGLSVLAVYDLGSSGLTVSIVDIPTRTVRYAERTDEISGDLFDALIREYQITSGRIAAPRNPEGFVELDARCRQSKEQLSINPAVTLPSDSGMVMLARESFEAMIGPAVEASARMVTEVVQRSGQSVQAVVAIGGGARIPLVLNTLHEAAGLPLIVVDGPETVAARGAALLARPAAPAPLPGQPFMQPPAAPAQQVAQPSIALTVVQQRSGEQALPAAQQPITPQAATQLPTVSLEPTVQQATMALNVPPTVARNGPGHAPAQDFPPAYAPPIDDRPDWGDDAPTTVTPTISSASDSAAPAWLTDEQPTPSPKISAASKKPSKRDRKAAAASASEGTADWFAATPAPEPDWSSDTDPDQGWYDTPGKRKIGIAGTVVAVVVGLVVVGAVAVAVGFGGKSAPSNANSSTTAVTTTAGSSTDTDSVSPYAAPLPPPAAPAAPPTTSAAPDAADNADSADNADNYDPGSPDSHEHHRKPAPAPWGPNTFANPIPGMPPIVLPTIPMGPPHR